MRLRIALALLLASVAAAPVAIGAWWLAGDLEQRALQSARDRVDAAADAASAEVAQVERSVRDEARALAASLERGLIVVPEAEPGFRAAELARRLATGSSAALAVRGIYAADGRWQAGSPRLTSIDRADAAALAERCAVVAADGAGDDLARSYLVCGARLSGGELALAGVALERLCTRRGGDAHEADVALTMSAPDAPSDARRERRVVRTWSDVARAPVAALVASSSLERERAIAGELRRMAPALGGGAALLALLLGFAIGGRVQQPLRELEVAADRIGRGDLEISLQPARSGASGTFSAFNRMARELQSAQSRAKRAERVAAWRDIARRIAHEIKNPLTPIRMSIETMRRTKQRQHPDFDEIFEESTKTVLEEVERLERIVTEFSQFARLPRPQPAPLDVREVIAQVVQLHSPGGDATITDTSPRLPIKMTLRDALPRVRADRDQLTQVLVNLVQNAIDAAESKRGDQGHVEVAADPTSDGGVRIVVSDDGPGIPEEERARILEPYYTTKARGTGLGLAIVDRIVSEHGGTLEIGESRRGGAAIAFTLTADGPGEDAESSQTQFPMPAERRQPTP